MALPLLLAGPIVRRVEPTLASVWVALREPADVTLKIWETHVTAGSGNVLNSSDPPAKTLRVGDQLHIALALIKILPTSPRLLEPGKIYSYDVEIKTATETHTLKSLGLLTTGLVEGRRVEALGFEENKLPTFSLPPAELTDLRVLFGSCRRPGNDHMDAMVWIDDLMNGDNADYTYKDALKRPHQLFLGGDQIYADDVMSTHLYMLIELSKQLIGTDQPANGIAREHLPVDNIRDLLNPQPNVPFGFDHFGPSKKRGEAPADQFLLPADHQWFPARRRFLETVIDAQMTTVDGKSHLFSFGEFAAMYLSVWSNACWPHEGNPASALNLPGDAQLTVPIWPERIPTYIDAPLDAPETRGVDRDGDTEETKAQNARSPFRDEGYLEYDGPPASAKTPEEKKAHFEAHLASLAKSLAGERRVLTIFESGLAKVRRALANIPTYMIFDDHDFTDDWNLSPLWYDRVYSTSLGTAAARNALVSYALFQDWGNDPIKYEKQDDYKKLLATIGKLFPPGENGPNVTAANDLDHLFGFGQRGVVDPITGRVSAINPIIKWHFSVPGPKHLAVAIDNRTRRSFASRLGPPGNVEGSLDPDENTAQTEQIPKGPFTDGKEVLLVIAPLQVIGPPLLDELVAPASFRAFDLIAYSSKFDPTLPFGSRGMTGTNPDAVEGWAFDPVTTEALFRRLEPYRNVVLLSGDVHYSASTVMSYFTKGNPDPARFVQFTSSGMKNVMPSYITAVDRTISLARKIVRAGIGAERLAWLRKPTQPIQLPAGKTAKDIPRDYRGRLREEPVLLPTLGWPPGSTVSTTEPPDWSWRVENIFDVRPDFDTATTAGAGGKRPDAVQPLPFPDPAAVETALTEPGGENAINGYQALAARHQHELETLKNPRQILFRANFGAVRFERQGGVLLAVHEMYTAARAPGDIGTAPLKPEVFVRHTAPLATPGAERPEERLKSLDSP